MERTLNFTQSLTEFFRTTFLKSPTQDIIANAPAEESVVLKPHAIPFEQLSFHALVIAINDYANHPKLIGAVPDAKAMKDYVECFLGVPSSQITTLFDNQATRVAILQAFHALADDDRIKKGDPILIYYAGHGSTEPAPDGWDAESSVIQMIIPQDHGDDVPGIRDRTIGLLIDRIAEKKGDNITVIFDCCFSGSATRNSQLDPTRRIRGLCSVEKQPEKLSEDCLDADVRGAGPAKWFAHTGIRSHILLAACGAAECAQEEGGRGAFTKALLDTLYRVGAQKTTYRDLISLIPPLSGQNPQCIGHNRDRMLFNFKSPAQGRRYYPVRKEGAQYIINVGAANGITVGAQFALCKDKDSSFGRALPSLRVVETNPFDSKMEAVSEIPPDDISASALVFQTRAGEEERLRLHIAKDEILDKVREAVSNHMHDVGPMQGQIFLVNKDEAELVVAYENGRIVFNIMDKRVVDLGLTRIPFWIDSAWGRDVDENDIPIILRSAAHYHWQLRRTAAKAGKRGPLQRGVNIEFTKLEQDPEIEFDEHLHRIFRPTGENLIRESVIDLVADKDDRYGFKITNTFKVPLYVSVFYFDNSNFSIESLYESPISNPNSIADPSLQAKGSLTLGYGSSGVPPLRFNLREGQDIDVGFIKLFVSTQQMELSSINGGSPFNNGCSLIKHVDDIKPPSLCDTILLTVVLRRQRSEASN